MGSCGIYIKHVKEANRIGKKLLTQRLIDGASGNMSFRCGNYIYITKTGVMLDELDETSFVKLDLSKSTSKSKTSLASSDWLVHREIYKRGDYKAVLHCHGVFNVVLSFFYQSIHPIDLEGRVFLGEVKVVVGKFGSEEIAEKIANEVKRRGIVVVRGHGIYCAGKSLSECYRKASYLEHSCEVVYRVKVLSFSSLI